MSGFRLQLWMVIGSFLFQIIPDEQFAFQTDVRIGWTVETPPNRNVAWIPVSFEFQEQYQLFFLNLDRLPNSEYPMVGQEYTFGPLPYPAVFSISVTVDTGEFSGSAVSMQTLTFDAIFNLLV